MVHCVCSYFEVLEYSLPLLCDHASFVLIMKSNNSMIVTTVYNTSHDDTPNMNQHGRQVIHE